MFESLKDFADLGSTVVVTLAFILYLYMEQKKKKNGNGIIEKIASNDLQHILKELEIGNEWHQKQLECLIEIKTVLNERKPK